MIDQHKHMMETRLMRLERANRRLAWSFGTAVVILALSGSVLAAQWLDREHPRATEESELDSSGSKPGPAADHADSPLDASISSH